MILPIEVLIALLVWGTLVGVDLVSLPQMMIARPLVAGTVAGAILGDIPTGLKLGVVFELLQYDILPVGAVRYPEYGPATVAAVATAHSAPGGGVLGLGLGALVGLVTGLLGVTTPVVAQRDVHEDISGRSFKADYQSFGVFAALRANFRVGCCVTPCGRHW